MAEPVGSCGEPLRRRGVDARVVLVKVSLPKYIPNLGMKTEPVADGADAMVFCPAFVYTYLGQIPFNLLLLQWLGFNAEIQIILGQC